MADSVWLRENIATLGMLCVGVVGSGVLFRLHRRRSRSAPVGRDERHLLTVWNVRLNGLVRSRRSAGPGAAAGLHLRNGYILNCDYIVTIFNEGPGMALAVRLSVSDTPDFYDSEEVAFRESLRRDAECWMHVDLNKLRCSPRWFRISWIDGTGLRSVSMSNTSVSTKESPT
jgi:hypothetical protein